jgi:Zn-dependent metalloprotease
MHVLRVFLAAAIVAAIVSGGPAGDPLRAQVKATRIAATTFAELRAWDSTIDRMKRDDLLRVRRTIDDAMLPGRVHERFEQFHQGVRVYGGDVARQTDRGLTVSIFGTIYEGIDLDAQPRLSIEDVKTVVERISGVALGPGRVPELVVLPGDDGAYRLTYRVTVFSLEKDAEYFIDAKSGAIVREQRGAERQAAASALGRGQGVLGDDKKMSVSSQSGTFVASDMLRPPSLRTYDARGDVNKVLNFLNGRTVLVTADLASSTGTTWSDPVAVDAHAQVGWVYDYYFKRHGRRGLDNNNIAIVSLVHPVRRNDVFTASNDILFLFYVNAFYCCEGVMVFGEGLPPGLVLLPERQSWNFLAGALDVIAHELTHGVTEFSSRLISRNEPGALNEAFSDIMGTSIEFFYQPAGTNVLQADYVIGEDVVTPGGIRNMANPAALGDPDHYSRRFLGTADDGGVHINSTIVSHAFYLAIESGTNRTSGLSVQGVGAANREQMEKVFYRAFTQLMPANATFAVARTVTIQAARDLYGAGSAPERAVTQAWTAVGVN